MDGVVGPTMVSAVGYLCEQGWLSDYACSRDLRYTFGYATEDDGSGWFLFHHHHNHVSFTRPTYYRSDLNQKQCMVPGCPDLVGQVERCEKLAPRAELKKKTSLPTAH